MGRLRRYLASTSFGCSDTGRVSRVLRHIKRQLKICTCGDVYTRVDVREPNSFQSADEYQGEVNIQEEGEKGMNTTTSLEDDCDPTDLLNNWLEELDMFKMNLQEKDNLCEKAQVKSIGSNIAAQKKEKRCSIIKLDSIQDDEMLAILGDLTVLESQLEEEIQSKREKRDALMSEIKGDNEYLLASTVHEEEERIKTENIKIAIEKIQEASIKKMFLKVFTSDGSSKSILVDETMTVAKVTQILAEKNLVTLSPLWALVELVPELCIERVYEDHELLVENCLLWTADSANTLWFMERPEKCDIFFRPEEYLSSDFAQQTDFQLEDSSRQELFEEYFSSLNSSVPELEETIWLKIGRHKRWNKHYCVLRPDGLYYLPKKKKKPSALECLVTLAVNEVYYGVGWKGRYKAPTEFCFGIKHPQIQAVSSKNMRYFCVETEMELHRWVTGVRLAKNGKKLCDNYQDILEDMAHNDIDQLNRKRSSVNIDDCLKIFTDIPDKDSPVLTPLSENKSFDSAFSSAPGSALSSGPDSSMIHEISLYASSSSGCMSGHSSLSDVTLAHDDDCLPLPPPPTTESITSLNMVERMPPPPSSAYLTGEQACSCQCIGEGENQQFSGIKTPISSRKLRFDETVQVIHGEEQSSQKLVFERECDEEENDKWCLNTAELYDVVGRRKTTFKTFFEDDWFGEDMSTYQTIKTAQERKARS